MAPNLHELLKQIKVIPERPIIVDTTTFEKVHKSVIDSLKENEKRIMASHTEIKNLLGALPDTSVSASMRDSLLAKIELLDKHIDRHFYRLDARFPDIE